MARTPSTMLELETAAPDFSLPDAVTQKIVSLQDFHSQPLLVMFICNHCPFVIHIREQLSALGREYQQKGVAVVAINANDAENYPADNPEHMAKEAREQGYSFPYLFDESQQVAQAYQAACTPDFFLFDKKHHLFYRGQLDDSRPGNNAPIDGSDLRQALDALLTGQYPPAEQKASLGCNIKWKAGNEPEYFGV